MYCYSSRGHVQLQNKKSVGIEPVLFPGTVPTELSYKLSHNYLNKPVETTWAFNR